MPTIDSYTAATASTVDTDDMFVMSQDSLTRKLSMSELRKIANTFDEEEVSGTTYTVVAADQCKIKRFTNVAAKTVTVPSTTGFVLGVPVIIRNHGTADITLAGDTGVTVNGTLTIEQYHAVTLTPRATDNWDV